MAKSNYQFIKRQKELARNKKKEQKRLRKIDQKNNEFEIDRDEARGASAPAGSRTNLSS